MIFFFSSDYNALYKKDILSALSLPNGHCVHFRYWESIIAPAIISDLNNLIGREGLIVYVKGNNPDLPEDQRQVSFFAVRKVEVRKCRKDDQTQLIHFSLELKGFIDNSALIDFPPADSRPPYIFVNNGTIRTSPGTYWYQKVDDLVVFDPSFKNSLFYHINLKKFDYGMPVGIDMPFDNEEETTLFQLSEGDSYILDLSILISDPEVKEFEKYECNLEYDQKDILISNPSSIVIGAQRDNRRYKMVTKSIENVHSFDYLKVIASKRTAPDTVDTFYETIIRFKVCKSKWKAVWFVAFKKTVNKTVNELTGVHGN